MSDFITFTVIGLTSGAVYGLAGIGLVLTYKTSGVFNFAHGALATVAAYLFYVLHVQHGWSWPIAAIVIVVGAGPLMGIALERLARAIQGVPLALSVACTVGLSLVIEAVAALIFGTDDSRSVPPFLPAGSFKVAGTFVQWSDVVTFGFALVVTCALSVYFRRARLGVAMRAVVDNPELLGFAGTSPVNTRRASWMIGIALAAASGVLFSTLLPLDPVQLTLLVGAAVGAAAIGAFTSLPLTFAGGLAIGVLASFCTKWFQSGLLAGIPASLPFLVLFIVLLVFPRRRLAGRSFFVPRRRTTWTAPPTVQLPFAGLALVGLVLVPSFAGIHLTDWTTALGTIIIFQALALLVRTSGQVSLCIVSFAAIGAVAFSHLTVGSGLPWLAGLLAAGLVAVPIGAVLAIPAIRLTGLYLALATFGFGILLQSMFYTESFMFGSNGNGLDMRRPHLSFLNVADDRGFYYLVLAFVVANTLLLIGLNRSRLGRLLRGIADSPMALETTGASVNVSRVMVFCISAFMAAIGGALVGIGQQTVSAESYEPLLSLTYLTLIVIAAGGEVWAPIFAGTVVILVPTYLTGASVPTILQLVFGLAAIAYACVPESARHLPASVRDAIDARFRRARQPADMRDRADRRPPPAAVRPSALQVQDVHVRFGGLVAVERLSLAASTGRITGLIGPNGAGKTTTFNVCSGLVRPSGGRLMIDGRDASRQTPSRRARRGLGRTFQRMELFESLSVRENVAVGAEAALAGGNPLTHVIGHRGDAQAVGASTEYALDTCQLTALADVPVMDLSTGHRRLVELARCLCGPFRILLLDEPSSGLDRAETKRFGEILTTLVRERNVGVLLVEHDMSLVLDICEHIYVLDFGRLIFEGAPSQVTSSPLVQAAYLGDALEASLPDVQAVMGSS